jgi:hypothetical protein
MDNPQGERRSGGPGPGGAGGGTGSAGAHPRRDAVIARMRLAGVLDLPGALEGW